MDFLNIKFDEKCFSSTKCLLLVGKYLQQLGSFCNKSLSQADDGDEWCPKQTFLDFLMTPFLIAFVPSLFSFAPKKNLFNFGPENYAQKQELC